MKSTIGRSFIFFLVTCFFYNIYLLLMLTLLLAAFSLSLILYLDLPQSLFLSPIYMLLAFFLALTFTYFLNSTFCKRIKHSYQNLKLIIPDQILIFFTFISYFYFISQIFYHNYFNLIKIGNDSVAHRLISHELFLNSDNGPKLVVRNLQTGGIDFTDIFYPLGFHSIVFYLSNLFSISVDLTIYFFFLIVWIIIIPLTIFFLTIIMTNSFRISLIFLILFLNSSEILLQYYYLGLWPFLLGAILSLFIILLSVPLGNKWTIFLTPLLLGLFSIYPSFAVIAFLITLGLKIPFTQLVNLLKKSLSREIGVFIFFIFFILGVILYITNLYVNILIVANSVLRSESLNRFDKFFDLKIYLINIEMRFFDFNSSRFLISFLTIIAIIIYILSKNFREFLPKRFFYLYVFFAVSLITSLISGIIGIVNYLINPLGLLFYYDFNRIYVLYLFFTILLISYALYYLIYFFGKTSFLLGLILSLSFLQVTSSFTDRLNSSEIPFFETLKISSFLNFNFFDDENFLIDCDFPDQDPTFICLTHRGLIPQFFTNEVNVNTRINFY